MNFIFLMVMIFSFHLRASSKSQPKLLEYVAGDLSCEETKKEWNKIKKSQTLRDYEFAKNLYDASASFLYRGQLPKDLYDQKKGKKYLKENGLFNLIEDIDDLYEQVQNGGPSDHQKIDIERKDFILNLSSYLFSKEFKKSKLLSKYLYTNHMINCEKEEFKQDLHAFLKNYYKTVLTIHEKLNAIYSKRSIYFLEFFCAQKINERLFCEGHKEEILSRAQHLHKKWHDKVFGENYLQKSFWKKLLSEEEVEELKADLYLMNMYKKKVTIPIQSSSYSVLPFHFYVYSDRGFITPKSYVSVIKNKEIEYFFDHSLNVSTVQNFTQSLTRESFDRALSYRQKLPLDIYLDIIRSVFHIQLTQRFFSRLYDLFISRSIFEFRSENIKNTNPQRFYPTALLAVSFHENMTDFLYDFRSYTKHSYAYYGYENAYDFCVEFSNYFGDLYIMLKNLREFHKHYVEYEVLSSPFSRNESFSFKELVDKGSCYRLKEGFDEYADHESI